MAIGGYAVNATYYFMASIMITLFNLVLVNVQPFKDDRVGTKNTMFIIMSLGSLACWHCRHSTRR